MSDLIPAVLSAGALPWLLLVQAGGLIVLAWAIHRLRRDAADALADARHELEADLAFLARRLAQTSPKPRRHRS